MITRVDMWKACIRQQGREGFTDDVISAREAREVGGGGKAGGRDPSKVKVSRLNTGLKFISLYFCLFARV